MLPIADPVIQFTILLLAALVAQLTVERARLPGLLGLLVLGVLLGPGGFEVLPREPVVDFLGHIGLVYVMFLAGLEIDLDIARAHAREAVMFGSLAFGLCFTPAFVAGFLLLGLSLAAALLLGALISSHTLLAYPVVERFGLLQRTAVVTAVGGTILTDTLALALLAIVIASHGAAVAGIWDWLGPLTLLAGLAVASLWAVPRLSRAFFSQPWITRAEKALFALVVLLVLSSATELTGTDEVLGAFLAGLCLNRALARREELREHIEFVGRMLFIPFFFIYTGMLLELADVARGSTLQLAALLAGLAFVGKAAAAWLTGAHYGYSRNERLIMAGLTLPQAAATLAITITAMEAGLMGREIVDAVVLLIFLTCLAGPLLTHLAGSRIARQG